MLGFNIWICFCHEGDAPTLVRVNMYLRSISKIDDYKMVSGGTWTDVVTCHVSFIINNSFDWTFIGQFSAYITLFIIKVNIVLIKWIFGNNCTLLNSQLCIWICDCVCLLFWFILFYFHLICPWLCTVSFVFFCFNLNPTFWYKV